jgi:hypothetical protein
MPYVKEETKDRIELPYVNTTGELTYVIDRIAEDLLWKFAGYDFDKLTYDDLSRVRGAMSNAVDEFYRRVIAPFEDGKILVNGDVFIYPHPEQWRGMAEEVEPALTIVEPAAEHGADVA